MSFFEVQPDVLVREGPVIAAEGNTLNALSTRLRTITASTGATGFPDAAAALNRFAVVASERTRILREAVDGIGDAVGVSGATYTRVDQDIATSISETGEQLDGARL